jgi:hypothetical protein
MEKAQPNRLLRRTPAARVRDLLPLALLAIAGGAAAREPMGCKRQVAPAQVPSNRAGVASDQATAAMFAALASRAGTVAPGMREVARMQSSGDKVELARAEARDACVRVAFEATSPVVAKLVDGDGNVLASSDSPATDGVLGEHGPVCVRRGEAVSALAGAVVETVAGGDGGSGLPSVARVKWMAWESP